jgi:hypothetical protein
MNCKAIVLSLLALVGLAIPRPYEVLGAYLKTKGGLNRAKLYPQFGPTPADNHGGFAASKEGTEIWGADVLAFLRAALNQAPELGALGP